MYGGDIDSGAIFWSIMSADIHRAGQYIVRMSSFWKFVRKELIVLATSCLLEFGIQVFFEIFINQHVILRLLGILLALKVS